MHRDLGLGRGVGTSIPALFVPFGQLRTPVYIRRAIAKHFALSYYNSSQILSS